MNQVRLVEMRGRKEKKRDPKKIFGSLNAPLALGQQQQQQQHLESVRIESGGLPYTWSRLERERDQTLLISDKPKGKKK